MLLVFGGVVTVVPLLTYTLSIRRMPLIAISFIQFLSPTMQFLLAVFVARGGGVAGAVGGDRVRLGGGADLHRRRGGAGAGEAAGSPETPGGPFR